VTRIKKRVDKIRVKDVLGEKKEVIEWMERDRKLRKEQRLEIL